MRTWLALVCGLLVAGGAAAASPQQWLERMAEAARVLDYAGVFVYQNGSRIETLRIVHRHDSDGERERLQSLSGEPREVIRDAETVTCIFPERREVMVDRRLPRRPLAFRFVQHLDEIAASYELRLAGRERVAGRLAQRLDLRPRDRYRYGYHLWLDQEHALLLKSELVDDRGQAVERMLFTELELPARVTDAALEPVLDGEGYTWHRESRRGPADAAAPPLAAERWQAGWLPPGFALRHQQRLQSPEQSGPTEHLVYSDGLASISVYVEPWAAESADEGMLALGATHTQRLRRAAQMITVVGEVPAITVERIAAAVAPVVGR